MSLSPPFVAWTELPSPQGRLGPLRVAAGNGSIAIYLASTEAAPPAVADKQHNKYQAKLSPIPISGSAPAEIVMSQLLATVPAFDIATRADGSLAVAIELFGGGSNALVLGTAHHGDLKQAATYSDFTDYRFPRFVRGLAPSGESATAIANGAILVAIGDRPLPRGGHGTKTPPYTKLADATSGVAIATVPPNGQQSLALFATRGDDGPQLPSGDFLGTLTFVSLVNGRPTGTPQVLFHPGDIYSFDVDVQGDLALVLGSTKHGPRLITCDLATGKTTDIDWLQGYPVSGTWIASPSVLALPGSKAFALAFYECSGSSATGIRYAQLDLSQPG